MTHQVLSDQELGTVISNHREAATYQGNHPSLWDLARAVEEKVLEKLKGARCNDLSDETVRDLWIESGNTPSHHVSWIDLRIFADRVLGRFGNCVNREEWEAEARRREREAAFWAVKLNGAGIANLPDHVEDLKAIEARYPLPAPEPREVVGKSGRKYAVEEGWVMKNGECMLPVEDAEAVASLLKQEEPKA